MSTTFAVTYSVGALVCCYLVTRYFWINGNKSDRVQPGSLGYSLSMGVLTGASAWWLVVIVFAFVGIFKVGDWIIDRLSAKVDARKVGTRLFGEPKDRLR